MALAGGANVVLSPEIGIAFSKAHMMAADGRCKAFDSRADGFVRAEGCGIVVLKRLSDALSDGDRILAVIRGSAVNQDGRSSGLTVPSLSAQQAVIRQALAEGGIEPHEVGFVEAHGTGTSLGDPIEARALATVLGPGRTEANPLVVGSVKTNLGHLEGTAGVAGLIKTVLSLENEEIPPHLHFREMNPYIDWCGMPVRIPGAVAPWPRSEKRRVAGVSAFGFSGTNAHILLEEAPAVGARPDVGRPLHLLALSARSQAALEQLTERYADALSDPTADAADICHTASTGRTHFEYRLAAPGRSAAEIKDALLAASGKRVRDREGIRAVFLFPGQGAQYAGMARELFETQPAFRQTLEECAALVAPHLDAPLLEVLLGSSSHLLDQTVYTQPALFAVEYAVARLWQSWGVQPAVVLGHSIGEYAAAAVAGVFSLADGLRLVAARARLMQAVRGRGGMLAAETGEAEACAAMAGLDQRVSLAAVNGPRSVVVSGYEEELRQVANRLENAGVPIKRLPVSHGFHSPQMEEMEVAFERIAGEIAYARPRVELISSVTGRPIGSEEVSRAEYWRRQVRQPVRFAEALAGLAKYRVFLEAGPGSTLAGLGQECLGESDERLWLTSLRRSRGDWGQILESLGKLYVWGAEVNWPGFEAPYFRRKVALPTYPFERQRYWIDLKAPAAQRGCHPLLGRSQEVAGNSPTQVWESLVGVTSHTYLADHRALGNAIFPLTGYLEMAVAAASPHIAVQDVVLREPLVLGSEEECTVQVIRRGDDIEIFSRQEGNWKQHVSARTSAVESPAANRHPRDLTAGMRRTEDIPELYANMRRRGMDFGPAFRTIRELWTSPGEAVARVKAVEANTSGNGYRIHPALLDGCFQAIVGALPEGNEDFYLPVRLDRFQLHRAAAGELWARAARRAGTAANTTTFDIGVFDEDGLVAEARGMEFVRVAACRQVPMFGVRWEEQPCGPASVGIEGAGIAGDWLVLADRTGYGKELAAELSARGARCSELSDPSRLESAMAEKPWAGIVHLWSLDAPAAGTMNAATLTAAERTLCGSALELVQMLAVRAGSRSPRLWLVSRGAQAVSDTQKSVEPAQALLWGMANAIAEEHPEWRTVRVDLDPGGAPSDTSRLCEEIAAGGDAGQVAYRMGKRLVSRIATHETNPQLQAPQRLAIDSRGLLENLQVQPATRRTVPQGGVEIAVDAAGLNFRDVLNVLGMFTGPLGSECAGRISALGSGVEGLSVGDEVIAFAPGSHDGYAIADARLVARKPSGVTAAQAATLPTAFLTARYTLEHLAKIGSGDRVLIHAAAGGVGLAAVAIAQRAGAEIFATAGSDRKREFLRRLGIRHTLDSRSFDFSREILELTGGQGVDIVLNALAGDFIAASFAALAPGGRFLEIGKRDIWTAEQVAQLGRNVQYHVVDLGRTAIDDAESLGDLLRDTVAAVERGELRPLPATQFGFSDAVAAYRYMAQAQHIGKIVLCQSSCGAEIIPAATYLITGGFGGIGCQLLRWLVKRGARNVVLVGRHEPQSDALEAIAWAEAQGVRVLVRLADVANADAMAGLFREIASGMPPLRGVLHAAGVLDDGVLTDQNWDRFARVLAPKTVGSWLLHELTASLPLDFFVMFSSIAAILGAPGQANYAAANAFEDALAHERRRQGLPALSVNWGAWAEGMAVRDGLQERRRKLGVDAMTADEALKTLEYAMLEKPAQIGIGLIRWNKIAARSRDEASGRMADLTSAEGASQRNATDDAPLLLERLAAAPESGRGAILMEHIHGIAARVLGFPAGKKIDVQQPLRELGLDSLMALEFRNLLAAEVGQNLPSTLMFNYPALADVAAYVTGLLPGAADRASSAAAPPAAPRDALELIEDLSEEEVDRLLASKWGTVNG
jgi:acyl transferase domain-containing protein/acyl carrier protein